MCLTLRLHYKLPLAATVLVSASLLATAAAQPASGNGAPGTSASTSRGNSHYHPGMSNRSREYYLSIWGVDELTVRAVEAGDLIRFNYRILEPDKAAPLNDKKNEPYLVDEGAGVKLVVPQLEKVGQLRQSGTPEAGKVYWMAFSNKGRLVKPGDLITIVIGKFRAEGLVVQ